MFLYCAFFKKILYSAFCLCLCIFLNLTTQWGANALAILPLHSVHVLRFISSSPELLWTPGHKWTLAPSTLAPMSDEATWNLVCSLLPHGLLPKQKPELDSLLVVFSNFVAITISRSRWSHRICQKHRSTTWLKNRICAPDHVDQYGEFSNVLQQKDTLLLDGMPCVWTNVRMNTNKFLLKWVLVC